MLNMNSPTVQAMMQNVPNGVGNMPVYYGNMPTFTTTQTAPNQLNTPYPSPKEMLMQSGQQNVYAPTSFAPRNIVGAYNPGYQAAFDGYVNPYMGYGSYGGYIYNQPMDEETLQTHQLAALNGLTYDEQIRMESNLYKKISRIVSKNIGRSEEEAALCEKAFDPYEKNPMPKPIQRKSIKPMHIQIKVGDDIVSDMPSKNVNLYYNANFVSNPNVVDDLRVKSSMMKSEIAKRMQNAYNSASERRMDELDIIDFFNKGAGSLVMENMNNLIQYQNMTRATQTYDKERFGLRLLQNNGFKSKSQMNAIDRYVGRYGVMPDGRPVSPGHDPSVAQSFSYNPNTGQFDVVAPNFIKERLEQSRMSFINSINEGANADG